LLICVLPSRLGASAWWHWNSVFLNIKNNNIIMWFPTYKSKSGNYLPLNSVCFLIE
jgi:hypothetical protein